MRTVRKFLSAVLLFSFLTGLTSVYAQINKSNLKIDSTERDNTKVVQKKNIRDTSQYNSHIENTAVKTKHPEKNRHKDNSMFVTPDTGKKKSRNR